MKKILSKILIDSDHKLILIHPDDIAHIDIINGQITSMTLKRKYKDRGFGGKGLELKNVL